MEIMVVLDTIMVQELFQAEAVEERVEPVVTHL
jgi:hypothetical protein